MKFSAAFATVSLALACALLSSAQIATAPQTAPATRTTVPAPTAPTIPPANAAPGRKTSPSQMTAAAGGGPGQVWVNTASKVYHCPGSTYYGKTKAGKYMTEDAAKAEGDRANAGKVCGK